MTDRRLRPLGMGSSITRRDFIHGVGVGLSGSLLPSLAFGDEAPDATGYPPALTGMP